MSELGVPWAWLNQIKLLKLDWHNWNRSDFIDLANRFLSNNYFISIYSPRLENTKDKGGGIIHVSGRDGKERAIMQVNEYGGELSAHISYISED